jgi:hypothetical protein
MDARCFRSGHACSHLVLFGFLNIIDDGVSKVPLKQRMLLEKIISEVLDQFHL